MTAKRPCRREPSLDGSRLFRLTAGQSRGFVHGLKYVLEPVSYARLAEVADPMTAPDSQLMQYADYHFRYNAARRVTRESVQSRGDDLPVRLLDQ